jgi:hypothetical protein
MMKITENTRASDYIFDYKEAQSQFFGELEDLVIESGQGGVPYFNGQYFKYSNANYIDLAAKPDAFWLKYALMATECQEVLSRRI